ncbi:MAG: hypothetical protein JNM69_17935 [Archangium sp.]|nr:hypothetical protein [Archangium sp.]
MRLFGLLLLVSGVAYADAQHLVFSGGTTRADGDAALASWKRLAPLVDPHVRLAAGFPKVVESASLPGLKPGFFIVVLGQCDSLEAFNVIKAIYPAAYTRPVTGAPTPACPTLTSEASITAERASFKTPTAVVNAFSVDTDSKDERGFPLRGGAVGVVLVHRQTGAVLDTLTREGASASTSVGSGPAPEETSCSAAVSATNDRLVVTRTCRTEARDCGKQGWARVRWTERDLVSVTNERFVTQQRETIDEKAECRADWGEQGD